MVMSRKRRNLLSKKRKNGKRNTRRSTKTHKNMRIMRGGGICYDVGNNGIEGDGRVQLCVGSKFINTVENAFVLCDIVYRVDSIFESNNKLMFSYVNDVGVGAHPRIKTVAFNRLNTCQLKLIE